MKIKYPRTYHLPFSDGATNDDKILWDLTSFENREVVISEKMDGENTTMTKEFFFARSLESADHPSRHLVKGMWGNIKHLIPDGWRICGENCFAKHSIHYTDLESYFLVHSIWNEDNECLSFSETIEICEELGLKHVPVIKICLFDVSELMIIKKNLDTTTQEGFVVRLSDCFKFENFKESVVKYVRKNHVQTSEHWMNQAIVKNLCKKQ